MSCYKYIVIQSKVRSFGQWAAATCAAPVVSFPVSTPLQFVNRCWSWVYPVSGGI